MSAASNNTESSLEDGLVRLVGGSGAHEGRVEIYLHGHWGSVSRVYWDFLDAVVVCRQLGYPTARPDRASFERTSGFIWLDKVICTGYERNLSQCGSQHLQQYYPLPHGRSATVVCFSK